MIINTDIELTTLRQEDKYALIVHLTDLTIFKNTLALPYPYTEKDADFWLEYVAESTLEHGFPINWAIRLRKSGELIGSIGRFMRYGKDAHRDEIGYWLSRMHRNKGYMTAAIQTYCDFLIENDGLARIEAVVFPHSEASIRALEKADFQKEGYLRKACKKNNKLLDVVLLAKVV